MKFLIDECLSPELAHLARGRGYPQSTHVTWLGLTSRPDHVVVRRAIEDDYVLVTHNTIDFRPLFRREDLHLGFIGFNVAAGLMSLDLQRRLFVFALTMVGDDELVNEALELTVASDGTVTYVRYVIP